MIVLPETNPVARIVVVGVGGQGGNAVNTLIEDFSMPEVTFYELNTDQQVLKQSKSPNTLQLGPELTRGLGAGGDPTVGARAAEESLDQIHDLLVGADMVFVVAGMGGGTGTGAAPVVAGVAKSIGALTIGVVTKPFAFEGKRKMKVADEGIDSLRDKVDSLIVVPNQRLVEVSDASLTYREAMKEVDKILVQGVKAISDLVSNRGDMNVDFADVKAIMESSGTAWLGIGTASGEDRAVEAARMATNNLLLDVSIEGARGVLLSITGGSDLTLHEVTKAAEMIHDVVHPDANIIFGNTVDPDMSGNITITVIATGFNTGNIDDTNQIDSIDIKKPEVEPDPFGFGTQKSTGYNNSTSYIQQSIANLDESMDDELDTPAFLKRKK